MRRLFQSPFGRRGDAHVACQHRGASTAKTTPRLPASVNPAPRKPVGGICSESVVVHGSYVVEVDAEGGQQFGVGQGRAADRGLQS